MTLVMRSEVAGTILVTVSHDVSHGETEDYRLGTETVRHVRAKLGVNGVDVGDGRCLAALAPDTLFC